LAPSSQLLSALPGRLLELHQQDKAAKWELIWELWDSKAWSLGKEAMAGSTVWGAPPHTGNRCTLGNQKRLGKTGGGRDWPLGASPGPQLKLASQIQGYCQKLGLVCALQLCPTFTAPNE
jgi:hypothetical protein